MHNFGKLTREQMWLVLSAYLLVAFMLFPFAYSWFYYIGFVAIGVAHFELTFDKATMVELSFWRRLRLWIVVYLPGAIVHVLVFLHILLRKS